MMHDSLQQAASNAMAVGPMVLRRVYRAPQANGCGESAVLFGSPRHALASWRIVWDDTANLRFQSSG